MSWIPANPSKAVPLRGAFYFPWYPQGWNQLGYVPFTRYTPTLGLYDQADQDVLKQHMEWAKAANIDVLIPTWRGNGVSGASVDILGTGEGHMDAKIVDMLDQALQHGIKIAILYECEAYGDPSAAGVEAELVALQTRFFDHPGYLLVNGLPVVFVYTATDATNVLATKYSDATDGFTTAYIALQTVTTTNTTAQPQAWFQFDNDRTSPVGNSYGICPGYWRRDEANPVTTRVLATWEANIASMVASGAQWQLINSFNEWGEGSQIEPSQELGISFLDALA